MLLGAVCAAILLGLAARPLGRWRTRRAADELARRASFKVLLADAERERLIRQQEAEGDQIPWR